MIKLRKDYEGYKNKNYGIILNLIRIILNPGFITIFIFRITDFFYRLNKKIFYLPSKILMLIPRVLFGIEIEVGADIDSGFKIVHGNGIVIGHKVKISKNVTICQQVTIGGNNNKRRELDNEIIEQPILREGVRISPGAKVIGPIIIGKNSIIGVNSVVTKDILDTSTVVGNNRVLKKENNENTIYKQ